MSRAPGEHVDLVASPAEPGGELVDDPADPVHRLGRVLDAEEAQVELLGVRSQGGEGQERLLVLGEPRGARRRSRPSRQRSEAEVEARRHVGLVLLEVGRVSRPFSTLSPISFR